MENFVCKNAPSLRRCLRAPLIRWARFALAGVLLLAIAPLASAATITVTNHNDAGAGSLRDAIAKAAAGDTIVFSGLPAGDTITLASTLTIDQDDVTIDGSAISGLTISGNDAVGVFDIGDTRQNPITLKNLTITKGKSGSGSGLNNTGNHMVTLTNCIVTGNTSTGVGGGISNGYYGMVVLNNSTVSNNTAALNGGGIFNGSGTVTLTNSTVSGNTSTSTDTSRGDGGGIYNDVEGTLTLTNSTVSNNAASYGSGGGIYNAANGTLTLTNSTVSGNTANAGSSPADYLGGGIYNGGTLTLINSTLSGNTVYGVPGSIFGGGIYNGGTLTLINSTLSGNTAATGGGIYNGGTLTVTNSTLSGNTAGDGTGYGSGGGIYNAANGTLMLTNSTLSGNTADKNGGGIYNHKINATDVAAATLIHVTLYGNSANGNASDIYNDVGKTAVKLTNTLIHTCQAGSGGVTDGGGNFAFDDSCAFSSSMNNAGPTPLVGALADNGGPTQTMQPINPNVLTLRVLAVPAACTDAPVSGLDQRGMVRVHPCYSGAMDPEGSLSPQQITGDWYDPAYNGSGFNIVMSGSGLLLFYYGWDNAGNRLWLISDLIPASVTAGTPLTMNMNVTNGGHFLTPANPSTLSPWGTLTMNFAADGATADATLTGKDGTVKLSMQKILAMTDASSVTGDWYDPAYNGSGFNMVMGGSGLLLFYYGWDNAGNRLWLVSDLTPTTVTAGTSLTMNMNVTNGGHFMSPAAPPAALSSWGTLKLHFSSCTQATATLANTDASSTVTFNQLQMLVGVLNMPPGC